MSGEQLPKPIHPSQQTLSLEEWIALPIRTPKGERPVRCGNAAETAAAHRKVRRGHALGVIWDYTKDEKPRDGDPLNYKIGNRFHHLQQHLFKTEGRAPAAVQQEAIDAEASKPQPEDSPEIRAFFERWLATQHHSYKHATHL